MERYGFSGNVVLVVLFFCNCRMMVLRIFGCIGCGCIDGMCWMCWFTAVVLLMYAGCCGVSVDGVLN